jgi:hypothetical protein
MRQKRMKTSSISQVSLYSPPNKYPLTVLFYR